jgi:hypothetical protein
MHCCPLCAAELLVKVGMGDAADLAVLMGANGRVVFTITIARVVCWLDRSVVCCVVLCCGSCLMVLFLK